MTLYKLAVSTATSALALGIVFAAGSPGQQALANELDRSATLVYAHDKSLGVLDPDQSAAGFPLVIMMPVYDRLIHLDTATGDLKPGLAESWELLDDGNVLELKLRQGVTFHDGEPFDAEAVKANLERSATLESGRSEARVAVSPIAEIEIVDEHTVRLHQAEGAGLNWSLLPPRLTENAGMMISPASLDDPGLDRSPVGAGPFRFVSYGQDRVVFERFEDYWDPEAVHLQRLEITEAADPEAHYAGLVSGQFNLIRLEPQQVARAEREPGLELQTKDTLVVYHQYLNHSMPPLDDVRVRQAFLYGIDREAIVDTLLQGFGVATAQFWPPDYPAYHPDHDMERYAYDPDKARALVEEAGYPDGVDVTFELINTPDLRVRLGEVVQDMMREVGVNIEYDIVEHAARGSFLHGETHSRSGPRSRLDPLDHLAASLDQDGAFNPGGFTDEKTQELLDRAAALPHGEERWEVIRELSGHVTEQGYVQTYYAEQNVWASRCVVGFEPPIATYLVFHDVGIEADCD